MDAAQFAASSSATALESAILCNDKSSADQTQDPQSAPALEEIGAADPHPLLFPHTELDTAINRSTATHDWSSSLEIPAESTDESDSHQSDTLRGLLRNLTSSLLSHSHALTSDSSRYLRPSPLLLAETSQFSALLSNIRSKDVGKVFDAVSQLNHVLSIGTEETLGPCSEFLPNDFVPELVYILRDEAEGTRRSLLL